MEIGDLNTHIKTVHEKIKHACAVDVMNRCNYFLFILVCPLEKSYSLLFLMAKITSILNGPIIINSWSIR